MMSYSSSLSKCPYVTGSSNSISTKISPDLSSEEIERESGSSTDQRAAGNGTPKNSLFIQIYPPQLTAKEIYRLKTTWSTSFESYINVKEAGIETIIRFFKKISSYKKYINVK